MDVLLAEQDIREVSDATGREELMINVGGAGRGSREGMNLNDGELLFPALDDFDIPEEFTGAIVALVFKGGN